MTIRPTHPDGTPLTVREYFARAKTRKAKRAEKGAFLWKPRVRNPEKPLWSSARRLRAQLDALWALLVKTRDRLRGAGLCRVCGRKPITVAYHILQRGYVMVRWDPDNGVGACSGCNFWEKKTRDQNPQAVRDRHAQIFGEAFVARLEAKKNSRGKLDLLAIRDAMQAALRLVVVKKTMP